MVNQNAAVVLIVCVDRDLTAAEKGEKWKCCTLLLLWPEMDLFKDIDFFCPRTQKCNICTAHLTTYCFNAKELGHVSFLYFSLQLFLYVPTFSTFSDYNLPA